MANFKIMRNGLNTEIVGDPHIGQSSEDVTVEVTDDGTYQQYDKKLYYSYGYRNQIYRAIADKNSSNEFVIPMTAFLEPGLVKLSVELSNGTNKPTCNACFIIATDGAKSVAASDILPDDATWEKYVESYVKSHADTLKGAGFSTEVIDKLEEVGNYLAYTTADGGSKWTELISILRGSSSGGSGETEATLSSISATYTGGEVTAGTVLSNLTGITVTATYSDGTSKTVTGYSLSGEILEGENTITVSYGGKTTTITVTGVAESGGDTTAELPTDGLVAYFDFRNTTPEIDTKQGLTKFNANQGNGCLFTWSASSFTSSDNYGVKKMARSFMFDKDGGTNQSELGTSFSVLLKGYDLVNGCFTWGDHAKASNINAFNSAPKYNTSSSQVQLGAVGVGDMQTTSYIDVYFVADGSSFKLYFNGELAKSYNGTNYDDFVSWYSKVSTTVLGDGNYQTALAIYDKALSEVEITEARAFLKTLEVA